MIQEWISQLALRLRNALYCVGWGVKFYSLAHSLLARNSAGVNNTL